jgi:hypothetical protein
MVHTIQNLKNFEFDSRLGISSTLRSIEHVINIIMRIRDMGCYRCSLGGYTVGTTTRFPVKIVEALAPQSHR